MIIHQYFKDGQKLYKFCAYVGTDYKGKQKQVRRSGFRTKKEAEKAYNELRLNANPNEKQYTFEELVNLWLGNYRNTVKGSTYNKTSQIINSHLLPVFGHYKLEKITHANVQTFVNEITATYSTGHKYSSQLKTLFTYAVKMRLMKENPFDFVMLPKRKEKKEKSNFYTRAELIEFLQIAEEQLAPEWYLFFHLLAHTGMRKGEALALTWSDIDFSNKTINIKATISRDYGGNAIVSTTKTKTGKRLIDIDDDTLSLLKKHKHNKSKYVFYNTNGSFVTLSQPIRQLEKLCKNNNIKYISPHGFRHTHCSMLFASGVSIPQVQARLGHSDVQTTLNIYNHVYQEDKKEAVEKFKNYLKHD